MAASLISKTLVLLVHFTILVLGSISIELIIYLRKKNENAYNQDIGSTFLENYRESRVRSLKPYLKTSLRRFGTLVFGLTCFCSIGFVFTLCLFYSEKWNENRAFLENFWKADALMCTLLLFLVIPLGLSSRFVTLKSSFKLVSSQSHKTLQRQRLLSSFSFAVVWIILGAIFGSVILHNMFFQMENSRVGFVLTVIYYMCGFGLFFVAVLVGFSGIYFPYLLYVINRDASTVRQLESLISDCNKARKDLKLKMLDINMDFSDDDDPFEDEFILNLDQESPLSTSQWSKNTSEDDSLLTSYGLAERAMNFSGETLSNKAPASTKLDSFFKKLNSLKLSVSQKLYTIKYSKNLNQASLSDNNYMERSFNMWMMMNELKNDLEYLRMLKREKESSSRLSGKMFLLLKSVVACGCMINCFKICKRGVLMLYSDYGSSLSKLENKKIITKVYYEFMSDDIVSSMLNNVLVNVKLPTTFDFIISRANSIFLACVMMSSVGYFLDFGRVLLKTKYLQRNKLMSDSSLGMAMACFMILTFPSQFFLVIPFLPKALKVSLLNFLFEGDIFVWFGLRHRFDLIVLFTIFFTFVGVLVFHYSRSHNKSRYVGFNV